MNTKKLVRIDNTKFIFRTNFSGDPANDPKYGSTTRKGNIIIPDEKLAMELMEEGFNIRMTKPKDGEEEGFIPRYYTTIIINFKSEISQERPPKIYLVSGDNEPRRLDEETVGAIDHVYVTNVNVTLEKSYSKRYDRHLLYVRVMYVEQDVDDDPYASVYEQRRAGKSIESDDEIPFT